MIERLRIVIGHAGSQDFLLPDADRQLEPFQLSDRFAEAQFALQLPVGGQVMMLDQVLPINLRRDRLDPPPQTVQREPVNAGDEAALAPFDIDSISRGQNWARTRAIGRYISAAPGATLLRASCREVP